MEKELDKCLEMIKLLRSKISSSGVELVSIGQFKYIIHICVRTKEEIEIVKNLLSEDESKVCVISRA
jgi:hypothetical protein